MTVLYAYGHAKFPCATEGVETLEINEASVCAYVLDT